jgi:hypothetical protein
MGFKIRASIFAANQPVNSSSPQPSAEAFYATVACLDDRFRATRTVAVASSNESISEFATCN